MLLPEETWKLTGKPESEGIEQEYRDGFAPLVEQRQWLEALVQDLDLNGLLSSRGEMGVTGLVKIYRNRSRSDWISLPPVTVTTEALLVV